MHHSGFKLKTLKGHSTSNADLKVKELSEIQNLRQNISEIQKEEKYFKSNPEEHKLYKIEWTKFWQRRCKELKSKGIDTKKYDFTSEWSDYWHVFIEKHYDRLINELKMRINSLTQVEESAFVRLSKSYESVSSTSEDDYGRDKRRRKNYSSCSSSVQSLKNVNVVVDSVSFVSVLRILSVLEDDLGSVLSNKVIDLLAKSLELERVMPNSSNELLMTRENFIVLETIKEKLKGLLIVEMLSSKKIVAVKKCIQNIAQLIHQTPIREDFQVDPDRQKIADMIEKEVAVHGKNDLTPLELDVLVDVYLELKEAQKTFNEFSDYENLSDEELKVLFNNYKDLTGDEKTCLCNYITHIFNMDPIRGERLKKLLKSQNETAYKTAITISDDEYEENYNYDDFFTNMKRQK